MMKRVLTVIIPTTISSVLEDGKLSWSYPVHRAIYRNICILVSAREGISRKISSFSGQPTSFNISTSSSQTNLYQTWRCQLKRTSRWTWSGMVLILVIYKPEIQYRIAPRRTLPARSHRGLRRTRKQSLHSGLSYDLTTCTSTFPMTEENWRMRLR